MNHGHFPRNGSVPIKKTEIVTVFKDIVGISKNGMSAFLNFLPILGIGSQEDEYINLVEVSRIGLLEHDSSLVRKEHYNGDYLRPDPKLLKELYGMSKNEKYITLVEFSQFRSLRFVQCHQDSPNQCHVSLFHHAAAVLEAALLVLALGDEDWNMNLDDIKSFLELEKFPKNWAPKISPLSLLGMTLRIKIYSWVPFHLLKSFQNDVEKLAYQLLKNF
jgi:hypothetical protein